ncbi:hypothetical protein RFI_20632, partial [Reticulomyxa filosa]
GGGGKEEKKKKRFLLLLLLYSMFICICLFIYWKRTQQSKSNEKASEATAQEGEQASPTLANETNDPSLCSQNEGKERGSQEDSDNESEVTHVSETPEEEPSGALYNTVVASAARMY